MVKNSGITLSSCPTGLHPSGSEILERLLVSHVTLPCLWVQLTRCEGVLPRKNASEVTREASDEGSAEVEPLTASAAWLVERTGTLGAKERLREREQVLFNQHVPAF